jgi:Ca2+-binding EF-hand superfamily protein
MLTSGDDSDDATEYTFLTRFSSATGQTQDQNVDKMRTDSMDASPLSVESPVRRVLAQILPVEDKQLNEQGTSPNKSKSGRHRPPLVRRNAVNDLQEQCGSAAPTSPKTNRRHLLERFRTVVLQRFRSVHDAFAQFDGKVSRDRALSPKEFRLAGARLGISDTELSALFKALDTDQSGQVTLTEFLHGLVEDISPESLLWELRCRLDSHGIRASNVNRAFDLIRQHEVSTNKGRKPQGTLEERMNTERLRFAEMRRLKRLGRTEWMRLGTVLGLTLVESERLFDIIDSDSSGTVDLPEMFKALQRVAPDVTLERFVAKVIMRYGTYREAFKACRSSSSGTFGYKHLLQMAEHLDINDRNAEQIWTAWDTERRRAMCYKSKAKEAFMAQMQEWAPDTVTDLLREQMLEQFGSVLQGQQALQQAGLSCKSALSISALETALRTAGFVQCDAATLLKTAARCKLPTGSHIAAADISLEDLCSTMLNPSRSSHRAFGDDVGVYWQQLHALKTNLRMGSSISTDDVENLAPLVETTPRTPRHTQPLRKSTSELASEGVSSFIGAMEKEEGADCAVFRARSRRNSRPPLLRAVSR